MEICVFEETRNNGVFLKPMLPDGIGFTFRAEVSTDLLLWLSNPHLDPCFSGVLIKIRAIAEKAVSEPPSPYVTMCNLQKMDYRKDTEHLCHGWYGT